MDANISVAYRQEVSAEINKSIDGTITDLIETNETMDGMMSISLNGSYCTGIFSMTGAGVYLKSNFSQISSSCIMNMSISLNDSTLFMDMGLDTSFDPPLNGFFGDEDISVGKKMSSSTSETTSGWINILESTSTIPSETSIVNLTMEIVATDVNVTVPAGIFKCYKIKATSGEISAFYYYSDEVGNYVKAESSANGSVPGLFMGEVQLVSFSYSGAARAGTSSIQDAATIGGIVTIAFVVAATILLYFILHKGSGTGPDTSSKISSEGRKPQVTPDKTTVAKSNVASQGQAGQKQRTTVQRTVRKVSSGEGKKLPPPPSNQAR